MLAAFFKKRFSYFHYNSSIIGRDPVLKEIGLKNLNLLINLSAGELYEFGTSRLEPADPETRISLVSTTGAMCSFTGLKTNRSPKDKRIVKDLNTENVINKKKTFLNIKKKINWNDVNIPMKSQEYSFIEELAVDYLNNRKRIYITDGYLGWHPQHRLKIRALTTRAYHALFMRNLLIVPEEEHFHDNIDFHIFNAGELSAPNIGKTITNKCCIATDFTKKRLVILGTQYAGEMKKGLFSLINYLMPQKGILGMQASANEGVNGDVTLLFGMMGTGKTTLAIDSKRKLIGDDEHCWSPEGIFNIEGGCYARCIGLNPEYEPEIFKAIKFGTVLENVLFYDDHTRETNYHDMTITENTRAAFPLNYIPNAKIPAIANHPKNIIFLVNDAFGVIPPVSKLSADQAMYYYISGYTSRIGDSAYSIKEPLPKFSTCFSSAFLPLEPSIYAKLMHEKINKHNVKVWLVNTGWTGGRIGVGKRMDLKITRSIIDAIHNGELDQAEYTKSKVFNFDIPNNCTGITSNLLNPENVWNEKEEYFNTLNKLACFFIENFKKHEMNVDLKIKESGPKLN